MSIISAKFYADELSVKINRKRKIIITSFVLILTYMVMLIPIYGKNQELFDIIQIVGEFLAIVLIFDGKVRNKLWIYIKLNIITGVGAACGIILVYFVYGDIRAAIYRENTPLQIVYYIVVIAVSGILCSVERFKIRKQDKKSIWDNIGGIELSLCVMIGILCMMYSVGMTLTDIKSNIELLVLYIFLIGMIVTCVILVNINVSITKREELEQKVFVLKKLEEDEAKLKSRLEKEESIFNEYFNILNGCIERMYLMSEETVSGGCGRYDENTVTGKCKMNIIRTVIEEKMKRAEGLGVDIRVEHDLKEEPYMKPADCVSIIANLLDNAIEAVHGQEDKMGWINAYIKADKGDFYCLVENTYSGSLSVSDKNIITTKRDKENHGMGIKNVAETVRSYGKSISIQAEEGIFRVEIR